MSTDNTQVLVPKCHIPQKGTRVPWKMGNCRYGTKNDPAKPMHTKKQGSHPRLL